MMGTVKPQFSSLVLNSTGLASNRKWKKNIGGGVVGNRKGCVGSGSLKI